jgi:hydrogenase maturation protein HypF
VSSFEGEAAIHLEMVTDYKVKEKYPLKIDNINGIYLIDDYHIFSEVLKDLQKKIPKDRISARFHNTLASAILEISNIIRKKSGICSIGLSGGVFQNNYLVKRCFDILKKEGFEVYSNFNVPVNDGGISLGQSYISALKILSSKKKR